MLTLSPKHTLRVSPRHLVSAAAAAFLLSACGGSTPESLPLADAAQGVETQTTSTPEAVAPTTTVAQTAVTPTTGPTAVAPTTTAAPTTTTTEAPPVAPTTPTVVVECATNPPTVTVTFAEAAGSPLDWELTVGRHPGGTGLPEVVDVLETGTVAPAGQVTHDISPNDLRFTVTSENVSGEADRTIPVHRYTGCPVSGSTESRVVDQIDCVSGAFRFAPAADSSITVQNVVVDRIAGADTALPVSPNGTYWVPGWNGPEEVKAIITYSDALATYEEHINHWCFGGPFINMGGDYAVCADEQVKIAYPGSWVSSIDLNGPEGNSCSFFRFGPVDHVAHNVTLEALKDTTLADAAADVVPPGPWVIADQKTFSANAYTDRIGTVSGGERMRIDLAWDSAPTEVRRVVWLIEVGDSVFRLESNLEGLDVIEGMASSMQFVVQ